MFPITPKGKCLDSLTFRASVRPVPLVLPGPAPPIPWPERAVQILHMAGMSKDKCEPLALRFGNWVRASMKNRFAVPIPLPHEVDGALSLFVGSCLQGQGLETATTCLPRDYWQMGLEARMFEMETIGTLTASSQKC